MPRKYKRTFRMYSIQNYQKEIEDLNAASDQGWQLVKGGFFHSSFVKNPKVRYRYLLDYRKIEDMDRYIETFRGQGWEYMNATFNGWQYFRKPYDPSLPESAYEMFLEREPQKKTDIHALRKALLILGGFFGILAAVLAILAFSGPTLPKILLFLLYVILSVLRLWRWYIQKKPNSKRNGRGDSRVLFVIIGISLLVILASIRMTEMRPRVQQQLWSVPLGPHIAEVHDDRWVEFEVYYTDYYYLELTIDADYPVTLKILNEAGESICSISEKSVQKEIPLRLSKGKYCISVSYFPRCKMTVRIS